jgi:hypothetical protein
MGILRTIRQKFGADMPDSAALTQGLGEVNRKIDANRAAARVLENELPAAVLRSIDLGIAERRKLTALNSEHDGLVATAEALKREIAEALAREKGVDLDKAWAVATEYGDAVIMAANNIDSLVGIVAEALGKLQDAVTNFEVSLPVRAHDYQSDLRGHGASFVANAIRARLQNLPVIPKLRTMAVEETTVALRVRPPKIQESAQPVAASAEAGE